MKLDKKDRLNQVWSFIKKYYNYLLFVLVALMTCFIIAKEVDIKDFVQVLERSDYSYLFLSVLTLFLYWVMEAVMLQILIRFEYPEESFGHAFSLMMIGQYYNQVTPSSSGGQPLQLIDMVSRGIRAGFATAVLVQKYALYQLSVTLIGIVGTLSNLDLIFTWPSLGRILLMIGISVNLIASILIVIVALKPVFARKLLYFFVELGFKIRLIKDKQKWTEKVDHFINDYQQAINGLKDRIPQTILLFIFNILAVLVYYGITYLIYRSLGLSSYSIWRIILIQSVLYLMIAFVPLPGAAGGAELGFAIVFGAIFGIAESSVALITWRIITFYFILAFGGIFLAIRSLMMGKSQPKKLKTRSELKKNENR